MTKKDYEMIAEGIKAARPVYQDGSTESIDMNCPITGAIDDVAIEIATRLAEDNPRFDGGKFLQASGVVP